MLTKVCVWLVYRIITTHDHPCKLWFLHTDTSHQPQYAANANILIFNTAATAPHSHINCNCNSLTHLTLYRMIHFLIYQEGYMPIQFKIIQHTPRKDNFIDSIDYGSTYLHKTFIFSSSVRIRATNCPLTRACPGCWSNYRTLVPPCPQCWLDLSLLVHRVVWRRPQYPLQPSTRGSHGANSAIVGRNNTFCCTTKHAV